VCTIALIHRVRADEPLVVAANRDEFYARPATGPAVLDAERGVVGGRDHKGGTWMGFTRGGLFVGLTNQRTAAEPPADARSRGEIVLEALRRGAARPAIEWASSQDPASFPPFNLVVGDGERLWVLYARPQGWEIVELAPGVHVLANDRLESPWFPKAARLRERVRAVADAPWSALRDELALALADTLDRVMRPAFSADAMGDLSRCVGTVVVAVTPTGDVVRGYGATEANGARVPDENTLVQVGSISKVFTGLALARLVHERAWGERDPLVSRLASDLATPLRGATVTLADVVSHRAGFANMPPNLVDRDGDGTRDPGIDPLSPAEGYSRADLIRALATAAPSMSAYRYSNWGLGLLGRAIADHLSEPGNHGVVQRMVARDLAMSSTFGEVRSLDAAAMARVAQGYASGPRGRMPGRLASMGVLAGSGEVVTSGADMRRFLRALVGLDRTALAPVIDRALAPLGPGARPGFEMGYAVDIERRADGVVYAKAGETASYTAFMVFRREPAAGVAVMTTCGGFDATVSLAQQALTAVIAR
jgi:uncharacterized protein with NRDE domain